MLEETASEHNQRLYCFDGNFCTFVHGLARTYGLRANLAPDTPETDLRERLGRTVLALNRLFAEGSFFAEFDLNLGYAILVFGDRYVNSDLQIIYETLEGQSGIISTRCEPLLLDALGATHTLAQRPVPDLLDPVISNALHRWLTRRRYVEYAAEIT